MGPSQFYFSLSLDDWEQIKEYTWNQSDIVDYFAWGFFSIFHESCKVKLYRPKFKAKIEVEGEEKEAYLGYLVIVSFNSKLKNRELIDAYANQQENYVYHVEFFEARALFLGERRAKDEIELCFLITRDEFLEFFGIYHCQLSLN